MRIIKIYSKENWTSPGALIGHILSGEELTVVHYGGDEFSHDSLLSTGVIHDAIKKAKKMIWAGLISRTNNVLWMGAILAGIAWPLTKIAKDISLFLIILFGAAFVVALFRLLMTYVVRYKVGRFNVLSLVHEVGPALAPPPTAHRETEIRAPSLRRSMMFIAVMIFMNCMIIASPAYPAFVNGQYIEKNAIVAPWVAWESTIKIQQGSMIAIVAAPETDQIWIARARYVVRQADSGESMIDWLEWTQSRFSYLTSQITQSLVQNMPVDIPVDEVVSWIVDIWESDIGGGETPIEVLRTAMIMNFQERYEGMFELLSLEINIEHITLSNYRKEIQ